MFPRLFHSKSTEAEEGNSGVSRTEMTLLLARLDRFESELKGIKLEWNDVYDKIGHLYDRTRKRIGALKKAENGSDEQNGNEVTQQPTQFSTHAEIMNLARSRGYIR